MATFSRTLVIAARLFSLALLVVVLAPRSVHAEPSEAEEEPQPSSTPTGEQDVAPALAQLTREIAQADATLSRHAASGSSSEVDVLLQRYDQSVEAARSAILMRTQIVGTRDALVTVIDRLHDEQAEVSQDIEALRALEQTWRTRRQIWAAAQVDLSTDPRLASLMPRVSEALRSIDAILQRIPDTIPSQLARQQDLLDLIDRARELVDNIDAIVARRDPWAIGPDSEPMYSGDFTLSDENGSRVYFESESLSSFVSRSRGGLLLHLIVGVVLSLVALALKRRSDPDSEGLAVLEHPIALGVMGSTALFGTAYVVPPTLISALMLVVFAASALQTARGALLDAYARWFATVLAVVYPGLLLCEMFGLPIGWMRVVLLVVSIGGASAAFFFTRAQRGWIPAGWRTIGAVIALAALANVVGYLEFSAYLLAGLFNTALIALILVALITFLRQLSAALERPKEGGEGERWRRVLGVVVGRLCRLAIVFATIWGALSLLHQWGVVASPREAARVVLEFELRVAEVRITMARVLSSAAIVYFAVEVAKVLELLLELSLFRADGWDTGLIASVRTLVRYSVVAVGALIGLSALGIDAGTLTLVAGALGVGVGLGLQSMVSDLVSGILLLFERPLRIGDCLIIDGTWGVVKHIGLRSTTFRLIDESELVVPNGHLTSEKIRNWTLSSHSARIFCPVGVAYGSDLEAVHRVLSEVASESDDVLDYPKPEILFTEFADSSLNFELRVWIRKAEDRLPARSRLLVAIDTAFRKASIEIAFPQRDLHLRSLPPGISLPTPAEPTKPLPPS